MDTMSDVRSNKEDTMYEMEDMRSGINMIKEDRRSSWDIKEDRRSSWDIKEDRRSSWDIKEDRRSSWDKVDNDMRSNYDKEDYSRSRTTRLDYNCDTSIDELSELDRAVDNLNCVEIKQKMAKIENSIRIAQLQNSLKEEKFKLERLEAKREITRLRYKDTYSDSDQFRDLKITEFTSVSDDESKKGKNSFVKNWLLNKSDVEIDENNSERGFVHKTPSMVNVAANDFNHRLDQFVPKTSLNPNALEFRSTVDFNHNQSNKSTYNVNTGRRNNDLGAYDNRSRYVENPYRFHNLPAVEPPVFTGDSLHYIKWKLSFQTLIESRGLSAAERMFYLQKYLGGKALKSVENFFYCTTEESYANAWALLEERYGHPFILQESFRNKLAYWPKLKAKEGSELQLFADFLRACKDAMNHIQGLDILNDCKENQKLVMKLPDALASRWNRQVSYVLDESGMYPSFSKFVDFVCKEARIACNPVTSMNALKVNDAEYSDRRDTYKPKAGVFATTITDRNNRNTVTQFKRSCYYCHSEEHLLYKCPKFDQLNVADRKQFVKDTKLCFSCLQKSHQSKDCKRKQTCKVCEKSHPTLLHEETVTEKDKDNSNIKAKSCKVSGGITSSTSMVVPVWLSSEDCPTQEVLTYAMLDNQSDTTFILDEVANSVRGNSTDIKLNLTTMTSQSQMIDTKAFSGLSVRGMNYSKRLSIPVCYSRDYIPADIAQIPTSSTASNWSHLARIKDDIPVLQNCKVGLLIGNNCPQALIPRDTILGENHEPYGVKTDLGWSIVGGLNSTTSSFCNRVHVTEHPQVSPRDVISALQADFKDTEIGEKTVSQDDVRFIELMRDNIKQTDEGKYMMPLPFKKDMPYEPDNKKQALARLGFLKKKFQANPKYFNDYKTFMEEIIERGDVEKVEKTTDNAWYIPHHGVYHSKKPDKIRVVFDCSSVTDQVSLNRYLLTGPDLTNNLTGVLCRFRQSPIAFMCDIKKMFHQFLVEEKHRDYLRFLWWEDNNPNNSVIEYRMKVHLFGAASSPGCANFALKHHAKTNEKEFQDAAKFIQEDFYVDDGLHSCESPTQALKLIEETSELCKMGGLHLHKFLSNSPDVMNAIDQSDRVSPGKNNVSFQENTVERALGVQWQVENDMFTFSNQVTAPEKPTRRSILSTVSSIYDPLGFISPFVLVGKTILQEMCRAGTSWDDVLPDHLQSRWERWIGDCSNLYKIRIPRCFRPLDMEVEKYELHHFSDGSTMGYGQCSYLRIIGKERVHCVLVASKARVAPSKIVTIPRLELTAACVSALMSHTLKRELNLPIDRECFWTDSKIVLAYINNDAKRFHVFVANRITQIHQLTESKQWNYVPTSDNPADHASRGTSVDGLLSSNWYTGPKFLWDKEWKNEDTDNWQLNVGDPEVRKITTLKTEVKTQPSFNVTSYIDSTSTWTKAVTSVAWFRRVANGIKLGFQPLSNDERIDASNFIIKSLQETEFVEEMQALQSGNNIKSTSPLYKLNPILQKGIIRVGGRMSQSDIDYNMKHPVILPKKSHITELLVMHFHEKILHQGRGMTQNEIRSNGYWIVAGSNNIQSLLKKCIICRKLRRPVEEQKMADLPGDRIEASAPFTYCGMDCFGPFTVKNGRREMKRYGLIITCLCCRGIHVEMLDDLTTDSMINALRCFISIRGAVRHIRCDQGSNFVGAKNIFDGKEGEKLQQFLSEKHNCEFIVNAPSSSHTGGVWERQIRTVRNVLEVTVMNSSARLDDASLRTFLYEAMAIVNGRPLAVDSVNDASAPEPLTPNHILMMKSKVALPPPGDFVKEDLYLTKRWRRVQYLTEIFWGRWKKEYLLNLNKRSKWHQIRRNMKVGDVVLVKENAPRSIWPLGIVSQTILSSDGLVRKVKVKLGKNSSLIERPIQKLVLLIEAQN